MVDQSAHNVTQQVQLMVAVLIQKQPTFVNII